MGLGLVLGAVVVASRRLPSDWAGLLILATLIPTIVLLVGDLRKLLLTVLVVDVVLGLDLSVGHRPGHLGGTGGFVVSLMTFALAVAYVRWLRSKSGLGQGPKGYIPVGVAIPALLYFFVGLVSAWQATEAWFSATELFLLAQFLLMLFFVVTFVRTWADVRLVITVLAACMLVESILMFMQYFAGFELSMLAVQTGATGSDIASAATRVGGTFGGPNIAATYLSAVLAITFAAYLTDGRLINKQLAVVAFLLGFGALVMTQSRSGWIGFAIALVILVAIAVRRRISARSIMALLAALAVLGVGSSAIVTERLAAMDSGSAASRILHSRMALNIINDHLFTGVGINNQRFAIDSGDYSPQELQGREEEITAIHNTYLAIWAETGLFGLLAFLWLLLAVSGSALLALARAEDRHASIAITGWLAAIVVFIVHLSTATFTGRRMQLLWLLFALTAATIRIARQAGGLENSHQQSDRLEHLERIRSRDPKSFDAS